MKAGIVLTSSRIRRFACIPLWEHLACPALRSAARAGASLPQHRGAASRFTRERHRWLLLTSGRLEIRDYTLYDPSESVVQSPPGFAVCRHSNLVPPVLLANNVPAELGHIPGYSQRRAWSLVPGTALILRSMRSQSERRMKSISKRSTNCISTGSRRSGCCRRFMRRWKAAEVGCERIVRDRKARRIPQKLGWFV